MEEKKKECKWMGESEIDLLFSIKWMSPEANKDAMIDCLEKGNSLFCWCTFYFHETFASFRIMSFITNI